MPTAPDARILFVNAHVFDGSGRASFPGEVLVHGDRIEAVAERGQSIGRGAGFRSSTAPVRR